MTWEYCNFELPAKKDVRSRSLDFIAVTAGDCIKDLATFELPAKKDVRSRSLEFIAAPVFTENETAELDLPQKKDLRSRNLKFIAVSLDCGSEVSGLNCIPISCNVSGSANFGDFNKSDKKNYTFGSSTTVTTVTTAVSYARNMFFDPDDSPIKVGTSGGTEHTLETNAQSYTYPRKKATISCDSEFYPVDFIGEYRYRAPFTAADGFTRSGQTMNYTGITAGCALETNSHFLNRHGLSYLEVNRWNWSSYNFKNRIASDEGDAEEINKLTSSMEYLKDGETYSADASIYESLNKNFTDIRGVLSPISFYSKNADVTLEGELLDISRVPVPCSYIAKAIIKLDGQTPNRCGVSYTTDSRNYYSSNNINGVLPYSSLTMDDKTANPWVWFHHFRGAASIGHQWWYSSENSFELQSSLGLTDHSAAWWSGSPKLHDASSTYNFCLQLGPIYEKKYNTDLDLPYGSSQSHPDYKDPDYAEYKYVGFGWGLYLVDYFHKDDYNNTNFGSTHIPSRTNGHHVHGPFCYSTHLDEFFEWNGPTWVSSNTEGNPIRSISKAFWLADSLSKYLKFKDKDYKDVEEFNTDIEDKFLLTPDKVTFTQSEHYSAGLGILNHAHAIADFQSGNNVDTEYTTYDSDSLYLNPFHITQAQPINNKKNPLANWNFKEIFIYDRGHIVNGGDDYVEGESIPDIVELVPELIGKPIKKGSSSSIFRACDYVELNWNFKEGAYLHSDNRDKSVGSGYKTIWGDYAELKEYSVLEEEEGYSPDNPNSLFDYPEKDYPLPYGKVAVEEIHPNNEGLEGTDYRFKITFDWEQSSSDEYNQFQYLNPFISESKTFQQTSYIRDFDIAEPFVQRFYLPNYPDLNLMITNVNPNAWTFWLRGLQDLRSNTSSTGVDSYKELMMYPRPTLIDVDED